MTFHSFIQMKFALMIALAIGLTSESARAQQKDSQSELKAADADADGVVSVDEMKSFLTEKYVEAWVQKLDANRDRKISRREFRLARKALERVLEEADKADASTSVATQPQPASAVEMMNERFLASKPPVGTIVKDLVAFDESGEEINLNELRGKHVVLIFGCLT